MYSFIPIFLVSLRILSACVQQGDIGSNPAAFGITRQTSLASEGGTIPDAHWVTIVPVNSGQKFKIYHLNSYASPHGVYDKFYNVFPTYCPKTNTGIVYDAVLEGTPNFDWYFHGTYANNLDLAVTFSGGQSQYSQMRQVRNSGTAGPDRLPELPGIITKFSTWKTFYGNPADYDTWANPSDLSQNYTVDNYFFMWSPGCDLLWYNRATFAQTQFVSNDIISPGDASNEAKVLVVHDKDSYWDVVFYRENIGGNSELTFEMTVSSTGKPFAMQDVETKSTWDLNGVATAGPLAGTKLAYYPFQTRGNATVLTGAAGKTLYDVNERRELVVNPPVSARPLVLKPALGNLTVQPNPFQHSTTIEYRLDHQASPQVQAIQIFDMKGKLIRRLAVSSSKTRSGTLLWNGKDEAGQPISAGIYWIRLTAGRQQFQQKVLLLK